jgi:hypothetical protein
MIKRRSLLVLWCVVLLAGCQKAPATPTQAPTPASAQATSTLPAAVETPSLSANATSEPVPLASPSAAAKPAGQPLPAFRIDWATPFAPMQILGEDITLASWEAQPYAGADIPLPLSLEQVVNPGVLDDLTSEQRAFLEANGFVAIHSQEAQFGDIRVETSDKTGQPYYLTSDAAFHALHLQFDELLKFLERDDFRPKILAITRAALEQVREFALQAQGTPIEADAEQALAYLSVALKLFDPQAEIDPRVAELVAQQVDQVMAAAGRDKSALFPEFEDDYGAYRPVGHYAGDPDLEAYFRGMTWFGRMHFLLQNPEKPDFVPSRLPLIVTLALRTAQVDRQPASDLWAEVHKTLTYVVGPSDDAGPLEYAALMDQVYGEQAGLQDLADPSLWEAFLSQADQLPSPQVSSLFVASTADLAPEKGWRFMGQRFTLDSMILQNVIFDRLEAKPDGTKRELPSGLDVMNAFGSQPAALELDLQGVTGFPNYPEQMAKMQAAVQARPEQQWLERFYDSWLYAFFPLIQGKDSSYPAYMQNPAWGYKDLNAALGSWAELKHDTALYTKMPEMAAGGGPPMSVSAPSYVEPNPEAFYRLAYLARSLSCGLQDLVLHGPCELYLQNWGGDDIAASITGLGGLGERFERLGDIAAKELAGLPLDEEDNAMITGCLGTVECMNTHTGYNQPTGEMPQVPLVAAVSGAGEDVLEVGVGSVDRIYVVVPLENQWEVAQGGIFSYYEFSQPRGERLTDEAWRQALAGGQVALPSWAANFVLPGGQPNETLFFRLGDVYIVTRAGDDLNVRDEPSLSGEVLTQAQTGTYLEIVDGPVVADGYTWWKFLVHDWSNPAPIEGWAVENPEWYVRSYRPDQSGD